jgi:monomeric sarcosine oxidase
MYDAIVVGCGAVGSAALLELADRGAKALGVDRFSPPHDRGSSHGRSRLIRKAYFEHPDYVPLVLRAYELWRRLEARSGRSLLHETGLVQIGPADGAVVPGVRDSVRRHGLAIEELRPAEAQRRFPGLLVLEDQEVLFEPDAGFLDVEDCIEATLALAQQAGATLLRDEPVLDWGPEGAGWRIRTARGAYAAGRLVLAGGAWSSQILRSLRLPLTVLRKTLHWFEVEPGAYLARDGFPAFLAERPEGVFYGFPVLDDWGLKAAEHTGGAAAPDPDALDRDERPEDSAGVREFLRRQLPRCRGRQTRFCVCMYTMTPDAHFVVDRHPERAGVAFAAGLSGHGFKFAPALGEILAELTLEGRAQRGAEFLSASRFSR